MTNRVLLYGNIVNEKNFGGYNEPSPLFRLVGLSNICYTVLDEIMECIFWRFPSKRSHWEAS